MSVDPVGGFDSFSMNSLLSGSTVSMLEPPSRLENEYDPLRDIYTNHSEPLPLKKPGIKDSNSEALIHALKALQLKIKHLEHERVEAADHFKQLSEETLRRQHEVTTSDEENTPPLPVHTSPGYVDHNFDRRLSSLDTRFALQSKELELLRERLRQAENDREHAMRKNEELDHNDSDTPKKVEELERAQKRLRASNVMTNTKLRELEGQLVRQQRDKRRSKRPSCHPTEVTVAVEEQQRNKNVGIRNSSQSVPISCSKPVPGIHYHLNMRDVPFVVGTSTGPSHSVSANYQKVLSLMKYHNTLLCGAAAENVKKGEPKKITKKKVAPPTGASYEELRGLLKAIEEEFGTLAFQHQELSRTIQQQQQGSGDGRGSTTLHLEEMEIELSEIVQQLENKMEQIELINRLLKSAKKSDHAHRSTKQVGHAPNKRKGGHQHQSLFATVPRNGEIKVVTTVKAKKKKASSCSLRTRSSSSVGSYRAELDCNHGMRPCSQRSPGSLQVLKGMKKLQSTLQRDDLSWS